MMDNPQNKRSAGVLKDLQMQLPSLDFGILKGKMTVEVAECLPKTIRKRRSVKF